ncbi:MAG: glycosyltransferase family 2 protein [Geminicoccaceae bacterium]
MPDTDAITFVLTSCGRFDLLASTLERFLAHNTAPIARYIVIEDSGDSSVDQVVGRFEQPIEPIVNQTRLGQMASIDRAYATIDTPYIFHCEDDWRFFRGDFIEQSRVLLDGDPSISTVLCRRAGQNPYHDQIYASEPRSLAGISYYKAPVWGVRDWLGYSFNPGLRRRADITRLGSFAALGHELEASLYFKHQGMSVACLADPACETTGTLRRLSKDATPRRLRGTLRFCAARLRFYLTPVGARVPPPRDGGR